MHIVEVRENIAYEGSEFSFKTADGRKQIMHLQNWERLGEGSFGEIFAVTLAVREELDGILQSANTIERAMKVFHIPENAGTAVRKHAFLRRYNFPLFEEYREDTGGRGCVLMPNGNKDNTTVVSWNRDSVSYDALRQNRPLTMQNINEVQNSIFSHVQCATAFGFFIPASAYFFHVTPKKTGTYARVSFDDTDEIDECFRGKDLAEFNVRGAEEALLQLCECAVCDTEKEPAAQLVRQTCARWQIHIASEQERMTDC